MPGTQKEGGRWGRLLRFYALDYSVILAVVAVSLIGPEADLLRLAVQLDDVHSGAIAIHYDDVPAIVHFDVVRHVAIRIGVGIALRHVEPDLDRRLRLADVPRAHAAGEVSKERHPAVIRITEVLLARMHAETRSTIAVVAAGIFLAAARIHRHRGEDHRPLPHVLLDFRSRRRRLRIFNGHIDYEA